MNNRKYRPRRAPPGWVFFVVIGFMLMLVNMIYLNHTAAALDFRSFWSAGHWLGTGKDPYLLEFLYPLWFAIFFIPFGYLPFLTSSAIWLTLNQVLFVTAVTLAWITFTQARRPKQTALLIVITTLLPPALYGFFLQQPTGIFLLLLVAVVWAWQRERFLLAGLCLALLLTKPHLMLIIIFYWLVLSVVHGRWRLLIGFCLTMLGLAALSELIQPGWLGSWAANWKTALQTWQVPAWLLLSPWLLAFIIGLLSVLLGTVLGLLTLLDRRPSSIGFGLATAVTIAVLLNAHPITYYDAALLALPLLWLVSRQKGAARYGWLGGFFAAAYLLLLLSDRGWSSLFRQSLAFWLLLILLYQERSRIRRMVMAGKAGWQRPWPQWPEDAKKGVLRLLVVAGFIFFGIHITWWAGDHTVFSIVFMGLLALAMSVSLLQILNIWYLYLHVERAEQAPLPQPLATVDVFIPTFHESLPLIEKTCRAALAMNYPHQTYLLDDGRDPRVRDMAYKLGIPYLTRPDNLDAKAGNINAALEHTSGEFVTIFDIDHVPQPYFLDKVMGHFQDPAVGFVQVMLAHYNQADSFVAQAAAEQTYDAFGPTFMGMHGVDGATVIGSNTTFRRTALVDIGGYKPGLAEDLHTSIEMHANKWQSVYVAEPLAYGLVPNDLSAFYKQQLKWARGVFDVLFGTFPRLATRLTPNQLVCYTTRMSYYLMGPVVALNIFALILYLLLGRTIIQAEFVSYLVYWLPFLAAILLIRQAANRFWQPDPQGGGFHWRGILLVYGCWPIYSLAFFMALLRIRVPFMATPKQRQAGNHMRLIWPQLIVLLLLLATVTWRIYQGATLSDWVLIGFAGITAVLHAGVIFAVWDDLRAAPDWRITQWLPVLDIDNN